MDTLNSGVSSFILAGLSYSLAMPILALFLCRRRFKAHFKPFLFGIITFIALSYFLVNLINQLLLMFVDAESLSPALIFILSLFSQAIAAVIAQAGKFYIIRVLKNDPRPGFYAMRGDALMFGCGYAGMESVMTLGVTMINYLIYASILTETTAAEALASFPEEAQASTQAAFNFLLEGGSQAVIALILQGVAMMAFSVGSTLLVHRAVYNENDGIYFRLAIIFHILMIVPGSITAAGFITNRWFETLTTLVMGIAVFYYGFDKIREYEKTRVKDMVKARQGKKVLHLK